MLQFCDYFPNTGFIFPLRPEEICHFSIIPLPTQRTGNLGKFCHCGI